jgi:hypothetical protein
MQGHAFACCVAHVKCTRRGRGVDVLVLSGGGQDAQRPAQKSSSNEKSPPLASSALSDVSATGFFVLFMTPAF